MLPSASSVRYLYTLSGTYLGAFCALVVTLTLGISPPLLATTAAALSAAFFLLFSASVRSASADRNFVLVSSSTLSFSVNSSIAVT